MEAIKLTKGAKIELKKTEKVDDKISLTKNALANLRIGLGWREKSASEVPKKKGLFATLFDTGSDTHLDIDCDSFVIITDERYSMKNRELIYYSNKFNSNESVKLLGDNLVGNSESEANADAETILIKLNELKPEVTKLIIGMNIYMGKQRKQNLALLSNAFIRLVDEDTQTVLARYDISPSDGDALGLIFVELNRQDGNQWACTVIDKPMHEISMSDIVEAYMRG